MGLSEDLGDICKVLRVLKYIYTICTVQILNAVDLEN